jgi:3-oxoacyl-[acyl-carrier-protein] synthase II
MSDAAERVVITGLGVISPLGLSPATCWESLRAGRSGVGRIESLPDGLLPVRHAAEIKDFTGSIDNFGPLEGNLKKSIRKNLKVMCREIEMGVATCQHALADCGLGPDKRDPTRVGVVYGCDYLLTRPEEYTDGVRAWLEHAEVDQIDRWPLEGLGKVNPLWLLKYLPNMPASHVAIYNDLRGPNNSLTVREASHGLSMAEAVSVIRRGHADLMLVGATGGRIHPLRSLHFCQQEKLAADRDNPAEMPRPFAPDRDGQVLGEGAAAMTLEPLSAAERRGANILAEVVATASGAVPPATGRDHIRQAVGQVLNRLLERAAGRLPQTWHLHAHGSGDPQRDRSEALGIADALGSLTERIKVVSGKSYFGSMGAGGGAVEQICSLLALQHGELFPSLNSGASDPECPISVNRGTGPAGEAFIHLGYSPQGQIAGVCIATL